MHRSRRGNSALLFAGFLVLLLLNVVLRRVLAPLIKLTGAMSSVDPDRPGRRLSDVELRSVEGQALAHAFNAMLDRLEHARHEADPHRARRAGGRATASGPRAPRRDRADVTAVAIQAGGAAHGTRSSRRRFVRSRMVCAESLEEVRRIARELRPEALDDLGLVNALIALHADRCAGRPARATRPPAQLPSLSPDVELVTYRVAQESLTNALRHSGASEVTVSLRADAEDVTPTVTDGKGLPARAPTRQLGHPPACASGAARRRDALARSAPGQGTEVRLTIPIDRRTHDRSVKTRILFADDHVVVQRLRTVLDKGPISKSSPRRATARRPSRCPVGAGHPPGSARRNDATHDRPQAAAEISRRKPKMC